MNLYIYDVPELRTSFEGIGEYRDFSLIPLFDHAVNSFAVDVDNNNVPGVNGNAMYLPRYVYFTIDSETVEWRLCRCRLYYGAHLDMPDSRFVYRVESYSEGDASIALFEKFKESSKKKGLTALLEGVRDGKLSRVPPMMLSFEMRELYF